MNSQDGDTYVRAMNQLIQQAIDYMGRDRAVAIANSAPVHVDENGEIREFQFGETEESKRAVAQLLLEAYVQVVGRQLVINMLQASISGQQLRTLENLCPSDGTVMERRSV
ncbi:hypothetical protein CV102_17965 [Natronococcus pandeyae]|uniref:Uncharacterized protein n=1 Tax=Natronococcus pandeyae TaxID=2055836 RepID=A0A8J8Q1M3_9EURY|nr:hypothetical protein [Natronococcus pandeyae]TYL37204.1 hypothetical protein CV102_17965 [Natronococcus pandeyae]